MRRASAVAGLALAALAVAPACAHRGASAKSCYTTPPPESIGSAHMQADGRIVMYLRAEYCDGTIGDGEADYAPSNPDYAKVKAHLGPELRPGGPEVPVRPFPDSWPQSR